MNFSASSRFSSFDKNFMKYFSFDYAKQKIKLGIKHINYMIA